MPLVAHNKLPTFSRLKEEGQTVLAPGRAMHQDIRELHIGILNMMPDAAIEPTERQFFRLIGQSNPIAQFYIHPFTIPELERGMRAQEHIDQYYESFEQIKEQGLDALIITGANVTEPDLSLEPFWKPLVEVVEWAHENVTSTLCSCLATHAVMEARHGMKRRPLGFKRWGVFSHKVIDKDHPLVNEINTRFDVPHSRYNQVDREQFETAGTPILVESKEGGVHLAVSEDGFRTIYFQGHPEYDTISLLKEYKREVLRFVYGYREDYPPLLDNYFDDYSAAIFEEYKDRVLESKENATTLPEFPEDIVIKRLDNTWHDSAEAVVGKWMGLIYQITHADRKLPFMDGVDPDDPLKIEVLERIELYKVNSILRE